MAHIQKFQINDRVVLQSVTGNATHGTVRWVGPMRFPHEPIPIVGIETDKKVSPDKDFPELCVSVTSDHGQELFQIRPNHGRVFLPEQLVVYENEFIKQQESEKYELALAKEYGLSLSEYHSQKEYLDTANAVRDIIIDHKKPNVPVKKNARVFIGGEREGLTRSTSLGSSMEETLRIGGVSDQKFKEQQDILNKLQKERKQTISSENQVIQFSVGSMVCVGRQYGPPSYGIVRWIGTLPDFPGMIAGVELEKQMNGCEDGTWQGQRFFYCSPQRGFFCPLKALEQDTRYEMRSWLSANRQDIANPLSDKTPLIEDEDMTPGPPDMYIGEGRGIQGHNNSCYLDSILFGLFALTDSFDELLIAEPQEEMGRRIKHFLWKGVVNPLRKYGLARYESVMDLQECLEEFCQLRGTNTDEKDPEQFFCLLCKQVLHIEPFLSIKRPFGIDKEYFVPLFFQLDFKRTELPRTEKLIAQMFKEQNISFTHVPSKLLLQIPRFGKDFKTFNRIIPSLALDVRPLLNPSILKRNNMHEHKCYICLGSSATHNCYSCPKEVFNSDKTFVSFCSICSERLHGFRKDHQVKDIPTNATGTNDVLRMSLVSVICIETSHYVCYTRSGNQWLFHDSMADRLYDRYNIPKVVDVSQFLNEWVYSDKHLDRLINAPSREIPEYVRRFMQDIYMCVYTNPDLDLYGSGPPPPHDSIRYNDPYQQPYYDQPYYQQPYHNEYYNDN